MRRFAVLLILVQIHCNQAQSSPVLAYITGNQYNWVYDDSGTGARVDFSIWRPKLVSGYYALGDVAKTGHSAPTSNAIQVKEIISGSLAVPTGSVEIWNDRHSGGRHDVRVMQLKAPSGYVCLGNVAVLGYSTVPDYSLYRCVKTTYLTNGSYKFIWNGGGFGAALDFSAWLAVSQFASGLSANTFGSHRSHSTLGCCPKVLLTSYLKKERYLVSDYPLCKLDKAGHGYAGPETTTTSSKTCKQWATLSSQQKSGLPSNPTVPLEENYCRNPTGKSEGPWCFVGNGVNDWEYCSIPFCKPSASCTINQKGDTYVGTQSITKSGRQCQRWDSQSPHSHSYTADSMFPNTTVADAGNFCRNPGRQKARLWCYTSDRTKQWEYCDVPVCSACKYTEDGVGYAGTSSKDRNGKTCLPWSQTSYRNNQLFPDVSVAAASNYCRNPDRDPAGPWCMVASPRGKIKTRCGLNICQDANIVNKTSAYIKKVLESGEKSYTFVQMTQVDGAGHDTYWCSNHYLNAVDNVDRLLGQLLQAIGNKPVLVTVSSDHGGDTGHGHMRDSNKLIPLFIKGPGVKSGYSLTHQVRIRDILPTMAWALGVKASPFWDGQVIEEAFEN